MLLLLFQEALPAQGRTFAWYLLSLSLLLPRVPARGTCGQRHMLLPGKNGPICLCVSAWCVRSTPQTCSAPVRFPVLGAVLLCLGCCQTVPVLVIKILENTANLQTNNRIFCIYNNINRVSASTMVRVWAFEKKVGLPMNFRLVRSV